MHPAAKWTGPKSGVPGGWGLAGRDQEDVGGIFRLISISANVAVIIWRESLWG